VDPQEVIAAALADPARNIHQVWPWAAKPFVHRPVYFLGDYV
jgi:hypothetical protein